MIRFEKHWNEYNAHFTLEGKLRLCISYNRKNSKMPLIKDKLRFILSYLKNNSLQEYHGATYGMTQPQCNKVGASLSEILLKTLKTLGELLDRNNLRVKYWTEQWQDLLLDGTERPIECAHKKSTDKNPVIVIKKRITQKSICFAISDTYLPDSVLFV